mgnify:CR=1 FL=1
MKYLVNSIYFFFIVLISLLILLVSIFWFFGRELPDFQSLSNYEPPVVSKVFASNGDFLEEYSRENRVFTNFSQIPKQVINCFLVAEDKNFYNHLGFDIKGIIRAFSKNLKNFFNDKRPEGASTITQQVAKNFLLSGEISYSRKIKEIILSLRIEKALTKEQILELYLNEIYLGNRSYGISAAALNYFNKSLSDLEVEEMALLAALPKAPSTYNPFSNQKKALKRRNWVLERLVDEDFISKKEYEDVIVKPIILNKRNKVLSTKASFYKEAIRREIIKKYDQKKLYDQGLSIISSLDTEHQIKAEKAFQNGIKKFDSRKGWRGPLMKIKYKNDWQSKLKGVKKPKGLYQDELAIILKVFNDFIKVGFESGEVIDLGLNELKIVKKLKIGNFSDFFKTGDIVVIEKKGKRKILSQIPDVNGGMVVIENNSGRILAMVGGYDSSSSFNRVIQAKRQPGSAFKPFVYLVALEQGLSPVSKILDAPVIIENTKDDDEKQWRPTNYGNKFYGLSTLRLGIEKSRNLMTVRLSRSIGLEKISKFSEELGIYNKYPKLMSSSLGSVETNLISIANAYAIIANGGYFVKPSLIDKVQDRYGNTIYKHDKRKCNNCIFKSDQYSDEELKKLEIFPQIIESRKRVISEESAYQMTSFLMGVIKRGTAKNINNFEFEIAGKTGTTNNNKDSWFIGFNSEITVGLYVGYDKPKTLGSNETGSKVAAPIFADFMKNVYIKRVPKPFFPPEGVKFVNVDIKSGLPSNKNSIQEVFKKDFNFINKEDVNEPSDIDKRFKGFY